MRFETEHGQVSATLENTIAAYSSVMLAQGKAKVLNVEHVLATLYAYGIDNVHISFTRRRLPTLSYNSYASFSKIAKLLGNPILQVFPTFPDREVSLCTALEQIGTLEQPAYRSRLSIQTDILTPKLSFYRCNDSLTISAKTEYPIPGAQEAWLKITPENYKKEVARSRPYAKHVPPWAPEWLASLCASILYPQFGIGHGFSKNTVFYPVRTREEWIHEQTLVGYPLGDEIARHSIVDRLGALALLPGRLMGCSSARIAAAMRATLISYENSRTHSS